MPFITDLLEALTIFCFGLSWPISIRKSYISRTAKGKSLFFEVFLLIGYMFGIIRKIIQTAGGSSGFIFFLSFFFYVLNFVEISIDVATLFQKYPPRQARGCRKGKGGVIRTMNGEYLTVFLLFSCGVPPARDKRTVRRQTPSDQSASLTFRPRRACVSSE